MTTFFSRSVFRLGALGLLSSALVMSPLVAYASTNTPTSASVLAGVKAMLVKEKGVHVAVVTKQGRLTSSVVADIGTSQGTETYVSGKETFTIIVTPTYAYLSGSAKGLTTLMGLTAAQQKKVGALAIAMKKGSAAYGTFDANLTLGVFSQLLPSAKTTTLLAQRDRATNGYQLKWSTPATSTRPTTTNILVIAAGRSPLPLKEAVTDSSGESMTTFSKWGHRVEVKIPTVTIPYAKVFVK